MRLWTIILLQSTDLKLIPCGLLSKLIYFWMNSDSNASVIYMLPTLHCLIVSKFSVRFGHGKKQLWWCEGMVNKRGSKFMFNFTLRQTVLAFPPVQTGTQLATAWRHSQPSPWRLHGPNNFTPSTVTQCYATTFMLLNVGLLLLFTLCILF